MDLANLGLAVAGLGAGTGLMYSSKFVPGKYKILPIVAGLFGIGYGGYQLYRTFQPEIEYPEPPEPKPGEEFVVIRVIEPVEGSHHSCFLFYPIRVSLFGEYNQKYKVGLIAIRQEVDDANEVVREWKEMVITGTLNESGKETVITGNYKDKCYVPWITNRVKFQVIKLSTGTILGESGWVTYTSAYI